MIGVLSRDRIGRAHVCVLDCCVTRERVWHECHVPRDTGSRDRNLPGPARKEGWWLLYIEMYGAGPSIGFSLYCGMAVVTYDASYVASLQPCGAPAEVPQFGL